MAAHEDIDSLLLNVARTGAHAGDKRQRRAAANAEQDGTPAAAEPTAPRRVKSRMATPAEAAPKRAGKEPKAAPEKPAQNAGKARRRAPGPHVILQWLPSHDDTRSGVPSDTVSEPSATLPVDAAPSETMSAGPSATISGTGSAEVEYDEFLTGVRQFARSRGAGIQEAESRMVLQIVLNMLVSMDEPTITVSVESFERALASCVTAASRLTSLGFDTVRKIVDTLRRDNRLYITYTKERVSEHSYNPGQKPQEADAVAAPMRERDAASVPTFRKDMQPAIERSTGLHVDERGMMRYQMIRDGMHGHMPNSYDVLSMQPADGMFSSGHSASVPELAADVRQFSYYQAAVDPAGSLSNAAAGMMYAPGIVVPISTMSMVDRRMSAPPAAGSWTSSIHLDHRAGDQGVAL